MPKERSLYRAVEKIRKYFPVLLDRHQNLIKKHKLVDSNQMIDFSPTYFEGKKANIGNPGYSRDHRPDKPQINFEVATGINEIHTALTIQRGNVQGFEVVNLKWRINLWQSDSANYGKWRS